MSRLEEYAREQGLDLNREALTALSGLKSADARALIDQLVDRSGKIWFPSDYIVRTIERGFDPTKTNTQSNESSKDRVTARAEELWIDLDKKSIEMLNSVPVASAMEMLSDISRKGVGKGGIRNPSSYVAAACQKINDEFYENAPKSTLGNRTASKVAELGLELDEWALDALVNVPLSTSFKILDQAAAVAWTGSSVAKISALVIRECEWWQDSTSANEIWQKKDGVAKGGARSTSRATALGLYLEDNALDALANVPLTAAFNLLDSVTAKGVGKGKGGIRNPSAYIVSACAKILSNPPVRNIQDYYSSPGNRSAARAAWLGVDINDAALAALSAVPLRAAKDLLDQVYEQYAGNGDFIRNPSRYVIRACERINEKGTYSAESNGSSRQSSYWK